MIDPEKLRSIGEHAAALGKELSKICPGSGEVIAGAIVARILKGESPADLSTALIATAQSLKKQTEGNKESFHLFFELTADPETFPAETARALRGLAERGFRHHINEELEIINLALPDPLIERNGTLVCGNVVVGYPRGVRP